MLTAWLAAAAVAAAILLLGRPPPSARLTDWRAPAATASRPFAGLAVSAVAGTALVALRLSPPLVIGGLLAAILVRRLLRSRALAQERAARAAAVIEATGALAAELRAGRTAPDALQAAALIAGPLAAVLEAAATAARLGASPAEELLAGAQLTGGERLRWVAAAWSVSESAGGRIAGVLERLRESMDSDDELQQELDAALAAPRATMLLLAGLPVFGLLLGESIGAHPVSLLLHRAIGWGLLAGAVTLDVIGVVVTRAIAGRVMPS